MPQRSQVPGKGADEPSPLAELWGIQPVIGWLYHPVDPGVGGGAANVDAPAFPAAGRYPVLPPGDALVKFILIGRGVCPLTAARDEQAAVGQLAAVNQEGAATLLVEEPHSAVDVTPG